MNKINFVKMNESIANNTHFLYAKAFPYCVQKVRITYHLVIYNVLSISKDTSYEVKLMDSTKKVQIMFSGHGRQKL